jgi:hypothetical protein
MSGGCDSGESVIPLNNAHTHISPSYDPSKIVPQPTPAPITRTVVLGESFWLTMPDMRDVYVTAVGVHYDWSELPWTGNKVGDCRGEDTKVFKLSGS